MVTVTSKPVKFFRANSSELKRDILGFKLEVGQSNLPKEKLEGLVIGQKNNYLVVKYSIRETKYEWGLKDVPIVEGDMFARIVGYRKVWRPIKRTGEVNAEIIANYNAKGELVHIAKYVNGELESVMNKDEICQEKSKQELSFALRRIPIPSPKVGSLEYYLDDVDLEPKDFKRIANNKITKQYIQWLKIANN
jgi:hypothetical protein